MNDRDDAVPGVIAPPPLLYLGTLALGLLIQAVRPLPLLPKVLAAVRKPLGAGLIASGVIGLFWATRTMFRAGEHPDPDKPVATVLDEGPFRYSRNPIYVAMTAIYLGITVFRNATWPVAFLPALMTVMVERVVLREEQYLEQQFGSDYREYKSRVGRWI